MFNERLYLVKSGEGHLARRQVVVAQVLLLDLEQEVERNDFLALLVTFHNFNFLYPEQQMQENSTTALFPNSDHS